MTDTLLTIIDEAPPEFDLVDRVAKERDDEGFVREEHPIKVPTKTQNLGNRFKPGAEWTGNAKGKAKGTKNKITVQRLLMESHLRDRLSVNAEDLLERAVLMAMGGSEKIMALLLDKLIASPKNAEDEAPKDASITLNINNSTIEGNKARGDGGHLPAVPPGKVRVICADENPIEGEFSHVQSRSPTRS